MPSFYTNQLACPSVLNADKNHETPGSETKDFITHRTTGSMSFMFVLLPCAPCVPRGDTEGPRWMVCPWLSSPCPREPYSSWAASRRALLLLGRKTSYYCTVSTPALLPEACTHCIYLYLHKHTQKGSLEHRAVWLLLLTTDMQKQET